MGGAVDLEHYIGNFAGVVIYGVVAGDAIAAAQHGTGEQAGGIHLHGCGAAIGGLKCQQYGFIFLIGFRRIKTKLIQPVAAGLHTAAVIDLVLPGVECKNIAGITAALGDMGFIGVDDGVIIRRILRNQVGEIDDNAIFHGTCSAGGVVFHGAGDQVAVVSGSGHEVEIIVCGEEGGMGKVDVYAGDFFCCLNHNVLVQVAVGVGKIRGQRKPHGKLFAGGGVGQGRGLHHSRGFLYFRGFLCGVRIRDLSSANGGSFGLLRCRGLCLDGL